MAWHSRVRSLRAKTLYLLLPGLIFVGLFARSLDYEFVWTDDGEILAEGMILPPGRIASALSQPMLGNLTVSEQPYYRPVHVIVMSLIDHHLGRQPRSFRGIAIALGTLNAILFTLFAYSLSRRWELALSSGVIYAAHPVLIESHVWIAALSQSLSALFLLLNLWTGIVAMRWLNAGRRIPGHMLTALSTLLVGLAVLSKEGVVVAPALLLVCWLGAVAQQNTSSASQDTGRARALLAEFGRPAMGVVFIQFLVVGYYIAILRPSVIGGSLAGFGPLGGSLRLQMLTAVASWPSSLGWLFFPLHSSTSDVVRIISSPFEAGVLLPLLALVLSGVACTLLALRGHGVAALAIAWIWIAFAPTSGVVPLTHMRALRYVYLSSFGVALLIPALSALMFTGLQQRQRSAATLALALLIALGLGQRTWQRTPDWQSNIALFNADVATDPMYREGYHMLATAHASQNHPREAKQVLDRLFSVLPDFAGLHSYIHEANFLTLYCGLSIHLGQPMDNLRFEAKMRPDAPGIRLRPFLYYQCGARTFEAVGDLERALEILLVLIEIEGSEHQPLFLTATARCLAQLGRYDEARTYLARVQRSSVRDAELFEQIIHVRSMLR